MESTEQINTEPVNTEAPPTQPELLLQEPPPIHAAEPNQVPVFTSVDTSGEPAPQEEPTKPSGFVKHWRHVALTVVAMLIGAAITFWLIHSVTQVSESQAKLGQMFKEADAVSKEAKELAARAQARANEAVSKADSSTEATKSIDAKVSALSGKVDKARGDINRDLAKITSRLNALESRGEVPRMALSPVPPPAAAKPPAVQPSPEAKPAPHKPINADPHHHDFDDAAPAPPGTVQINDHWILPNPETRKDTEVIPFAHNTSGVMVHNLQDGKHYLIDKSGVWIGKASE